MEKLACVNEYLLILNEPDRADDMWLRSDYPLTSMPDTASAKWDGSIVVSVLTWLNAFIV